MQVADEKLIINELRPNILHCYYFGVPVTSAREYGKAGNGNERETGNGNWKWKPETENRNGNATSSLL